MPKSGKPLESQPVEEEQLETKVVESEAIESESVESESMESKRLESKVVECLYEIVNEVVVPCEAFDTSVGRAPPPRTRRGLLIALEGGDRCGKSTQAERLKERLAREGKGCELLKFPDRTSPTGRVLDLFLRQEVELPDRAAHLLFSANRWEAEDRICSLLGKGTHVVLDRYVDSGVAYSVARGVDAGWALFSDVGLPLPDLVLELAVPEVDRASRPNFGEERYETELLQRAATRAFARRRRHGWIHVNATGSQDEVWTRVEAAIGPVLATNPGPLQFFEAVV